MLKRQEELLQLLTLYGKTNPGEWLSKETICKALERYYPRHEEFKSEHNSIVFTKLRKDISSLNKSDEVEIIIISNQKGYRMAVDIEETERYLKNEYKNCIKKLSRWSKKLKKARANGQCTIDFETGAITEIKTFLGN